MSYIITKEKDHEVLVTTCETLKELLRALKQAEEEACEIDWEWEEKNDNLGGA